MNHQHVENQTYTTGLENEVWNVIAQDYDESLALDFLNSSAFRSFGESLTNIIAKKMPVGLKTSPQTYLKNCAKEKNIEVTSINTYTNWFKHGTRPKKSMESRETMFRIAFALNFTVDETVDLFHKVYLDRAFDYREFREVIYYYCIAHNLSFQHAQEMISSVCFAESPEDEKTLKTVLLKNSAMTSESEAELIHFINTHSYNFNLGRSNVTGQQRVEELKETAIQFANEEVDLLGLRDEYKNRSGKSVNFLYSVITERAASNEAGTKSSFKNAMLPKEIKQCFPNPAVFAKNNPTNEEVRKMIIFLFSYSSWYRVQFDEEVYDFDEYVDDLNNILFESNMPTLYAGNPYDWLFMTCSAADRPLDTFRGILSEAVIEE